MEGNKKVEKRRNFKKKMQKPPISTPLVGATSKQATPGGTNNLKIIRSTLKIPTNFDVFAAKQMHNYKSSKAFEMFKERNKKYTTVEERFQQEDGGSEPTAIPAATCPMDFLDESTRELIRDYEQRNNASTSAPPPAAFMPTFAVPGSCSGGSVYVGERLEKFGPSMPMPGVVFDPTMPPPNFPRTPLQCQFPPTPTQQAQKSAAPSSGTAERPNEKDIKREAVDTEMPDEIPSFQSPPSSTNSAAAATHSLKTEAEFQEDEEKKRKQALLWSLCEEELTVTSAIGNSTKRIENIRRKLEQYQSTLAGEEENLKKLKVKSDQLMERRIGLLKSVDAKGGGK